MSAVIGMEGHYEFIVTDSEGVIRNRFDTVTEPGPKPNMLTDLFFNQLAERMNTTSAFTSVYGSLSTSTATPTTSDISLPNRVATVQSNTYVAATTGSGMDWYTTYTYTCAFAKNAYVGTFSTVGLCRTNDGLNLMSRLRLKDGNGDPTSMTLITDDQLTLVYTLRAKRPNTISTGQVTINGTVHDWTLAKYNIDATVSTKWLVMPCYWFSRLYAILGNADDPASLYTTAQITIPTDLLGAVSTSGYITGPALTHSYTAGNNYGDLTLTLNTATANNQPISYVAFSRGSDSGVNNSDCAWASFNPPITKTNTQTLTLTWRITFGRI